MERRPLLAGSMDVRQRYRIPWALRHCRYQRLIVELKRRYLHTPGYSPGTMASDASVLSLDRSVSTQDQLPRRRRSKAAHCHAWPCTRLRAVSCTGSDKPLSQPSLPILNTAAKPDWPGQRDFDGGSTSPPFCAAQIPGRNRCHACGDARSFKDEPLLRYCRRTPAEPLPSSISPQLNHHRALSILA